MVDYLGQGSQASGTSNQNGTINTTSSGATNSTTVANTTGSGSSQAAAANTYSPQQQAAQNAALQAGTNYLQTGNLPGTFGAPPQVTQAYVDNWKQNVAPQLAAQYGAGSPALGSSLALGLEQLQAQVYQNQSANFSGALGQVSNAAFNALGQTQNSQQQQQENGTTNTRSMFWQNQDQTINMANAATNIGATAPNYNK